MDGDRAQTDCSVYNKLKFEQHDHILLWDWSEGRIKGLDSESESSRTEYRIYFNCQRAVEPYNEMC